MDPQSFISTFLLQYDPMLVISFTMGVIVLFEAISSDPFLLSKTSYFLRKMSEIDIFLKTTTLCPQRTFAIAFPDLIINTNFVVVDCSKRFLSTRTLHNSSNASFQCFMTCPMLLIHYTVAPTKATTNIHSFYFNDSNCFEP